MKEESEKVGLKLIIHKSKIIASGPITPWQIDGETVETVTDFILEVSKITADGDSIHEIKRRLFFGRKFQFSSVAQSCLTLCDPMNRSTPGLPVHHQLPEFTQTHVHRVSDAIQAISSSVIPFSSCPQSLPASESFPMSQLFA